VKTLRWIGRGFVLTMLAALLLYILSTSHVPLIGIFIVGAMYGMAVEGILCEWINKG
jgi:hypothetical protein